MVLEPLPKVTSKTSSKFTDQELIDFFEKVRTNFDKYEYDGPESMARTPKFDNNNRSSKKQKSAQNSTKNTVNPELQAMKDTACEFIQNE